MKKQNEILVAILALAGLAAYYFFFRKKPVGSTATSGGTGAAAGSPSVQYVPLQTVAPASSKSNGLGQQLAAAGTNAAANLAKSLLSSLGGGGKSGGGSGGGGGFGSRTSGTGSSSGSSNLNQPLTYTDPNTGVTYDAWTQTPISGPLGGAVFNQPNIGNLGSPTNPDVNPASDFGATNDISPVDLAPTPVGDTSSASGADNSAPVDTSGADLSSVDLSNSDFSAVDTSGDFSGDLGGG